ncbi:MAG: NAD(P)-binding domain-containing protein [Spirochaetes bacterium]|jgi:2-dehydropantoate 2-reductase|nr:NAD(P)-binding domain-containing protein [Spirochaetota bacterium]
MQEIREIAVIGAGAIGAVYGSLLHAAYPGRVRFVADRARAERLAGAGVVVNGVSHAVPAVSPQTFEVQPDLILLAVKYHHLSAAMELIEEIRSPDTIVLSILNGIDSEEIIAGRVGWDHVLYGMALAIDAVRMLWWKFMINIGMNQISAVLGAPYREFQENDHARALIDRAMGECVAVARAEGIELSDADITRWHDVLQRLAPEGKTSMLQDIEAGRKTEVEMLAGQLTERAARHGIEAHCNEALFHMIKVYEARSGAVS